MSKTRRQRVTEHPDMPKKGVRDPRRMVKDITATILNNITQSLSDEERAQALLAGKNPAAVELGRLGGKAHQDVRGFQHLSDEERSRIAKLGVEGRRRKQQGEEGELKEAV